MMNASSPGSLLYSLFIRDPDDINDSALRLICDRRYVQLQLHYLLSREVGAWCSGKWQVKEADGWVGFPDEGEILVLTTHIQLMKHIRWQFVGGMGLDGGGRPMDWSWQWQRMEALKRTASSVK